MNIKLSASQSGALFIGAAQNTIYYNITGSSVSVTGSYGPVSSSTVSGVFSFPVTLSDDISKYQTISIEIADASSGLALAAGVAAITAGNLTLSIELGPTNKTCYQVNAIIPNYAYNFENNTMSSVATGMDIENDICSGNTGFELDNPTLSTSNVAYMGNGIFANYLTVPPTTYFQTTSSKSKGFVKTGTVPSTSGSGTYPVTVGDVYCVKMTAGGYAWLQVTNAGNVSSSIGPSFVFRLNTTASYCAYEQSTCGFGTQTITQTPTYTPTNTPTSTPTVAVISIIPFPLFTPSGGIAVAPSTGAATTVFVNESNGAVGWIAGFNISPTASPIATAGYASSNISGGLAINNAGTTIVKACPTQGLVVAYSSAGGGAPTTVGSSVSDQGNYANYSSTNAAGGQWVFPVAVAFDSSNNVYGTDFNTGGGPCQDGVMTFSSSALSSPVTYWNGSLQCTSPYGIAATIIGGSTYVYVADDYNNAIELYNGNGVALGSWSTDRGPGFSISNPVGIGLNGNGKLFIADSTGSFRILEWNISTPTSPTFVAEFTSIGTLSVNFSSTTPVGVAVDNATPPNVFVTDYANSRAIGFKGY